MDAFFTISPPVPVEAPNGDTDVFIDYERGNLGSGHSGCVIVWCVLLNQMSSRCQVKPHCRIGAQILTQTVVVGGLTRQNSD